MCPQNSQVLFSQAIVNIFGQKRHIIQQQHNFCLSQNNLEIICNENSGVYRAVLSDSYDFNVITPSKTIEFKIFGDIAPVINAAFRANFSKLTVKDNKYIDLDGQWYMPVFNTENADFDYFSDGKKIVLVQNKDFTAKLFNFVQPLDIGFFIPQRIEIYNKSNRNKLCIKKILIDYFKFEKL